MPTPTRYRALQWFHDHEEGGPDAVFNRRPPSGRMRRLMAKQGEVIKLPLGQFDHFKWRLTAQGREVLKNKPKVRQRKHQPRTRAKELSDA